MTHQFKLIGHLEARFRGLWRCVLCGEEAYSKIEAKRKTDNLECRTRPTGRLNAIRRQA